jgi:Cysteine rich repeat
MHNTSPLHYLCLAILSVFLATTFPHSGDAQTRAGPGTLAADCATDLQKYCSKVLPGADRLVACLIAYEDKVSPRCRLTAYISSGNLGSRMKQLQAMAKTCWSDIVQYCTRVQQGGGRVYDCLKKNRATLNDDCRNELPRLEPVLRN